MSYGLKGSSGTRVFKDASRREGESLVARRGGSSKLFEGRKLKSSRIMAQQSASSREMKCATPLFSLCVIAPPSSCLVTSSCVTVLITSGPVTNMYEVSRVMKIKSVIAGEYTAPPAH